MSKLQARLDAWQPSYSMEVDGAEIEEDGEREQVGNESCYAVECDGGEEEIDLEGYEEYLEQLKSKAAVRPCSARLVRPMPSESPQFYMVNTSNPTSAKPVRPVSARPRLNNSARSLSGGRAASTTKACSSGGGVRRKRQGEALVHARIRAVYGDVGRSVPAATRRMQTSLPPAASASSKGKVFQEAELHDEYYRLVDAVTELKSNWQQEQQKRVKAVARVRRLEEIVAMKDKKIEALLHAKSLGSDRSMGGGGSVAQREMAQRDRQLHALAQKLRQKIAQQSQLLGSYEEAMQSLRSGVKSTNLMELEEERNQLYLELRHLQELLARERLEWEMQERKLVEFVELDAANKLQIARLQQDNKAVVHEKHRLEQEISFLKSQVEQLQGNLALEQRKRTYDREFGENVNKHTSASPSRSVKLSQALDEIKQLMRRESAASVQREKLKCPKSTAPTPKSARVSISATPSAASAVLANLPVPKTPSRATQVPQRRPRPLSAGPTRPHRTAAIPTAATKSTTELPSTVTDINDALNIKADPELDTPPDETTSVVVQELAVSGTESTTPKAVHMAPSKDSVTGGIPPESLQPETQEVGVNLAAESVIDASCGMVLGREDPKHDQSEMKSVVKDTEIHPGGAGLSSASESDGEAVPVEEAEQKPPTAEGAGLTEDEMGELHRQKIADVERMLREVDDDIGHDMGESDLSADFMDVTQQQLGDTTHEDSAVSLQLSNTGEDDLDQFMTTVVSSNPSLEGLDPGLQLNATDTSSGQVNGETDRMLADEDVALVVPPPQSSYEDMYPSDFLDGDVPSPQESGAGEEDTTQTDSS